MANKFIDFKIRVAKKEVDNTLKSYNVRQGRTIRVVLPQRGKTTKLIDQELSALPPGKRISKTGNTYWETRANRSDKSQAAKL